MNKDLYGGGGGSRTPVRRAERSGDYMLVSFAYRFRQRPSGTGNNEPPASLNSAEADLAQNSEAMNFEPSRQSTPLSLMRA